MTSTTLQRCLLIYLVFLALSFLLPVLWPAIFRFNLMTIAWFSIGMLVGIVMLIVIGKLQNKRK